MCLVTCRTNRVAGVMALRSSGLPVTPDLSPFSRLENPKFPSILARLEESPVCQRLPLTSFLILPFQRITRLKMLVEVPRGRQAAVRAGQADATVPATAPLGHPQVARVTLGEIMVCLTLTDFTLQNILKRTAQGSEDEDMATKAFNALKEVSLAREGLSGCCGPLSPNPQCVSKRAPAFRASGSQVGF